MKSAFHQLCSDLIWFSAILSQLMQFWRGNPLLWRPLVPDPRYSWSKERTWNWSALHRECEEIHFILSDLNWFKSVQIQNPVLDVAHRICPVFSFRLNICPIFFRPTPEVEWVKMGHQLPEKATKENHGKLLNIPGAEQGDSGKYMCKAKNPLGEDVHYFTVTVEGNSRTGGCKACSGVIIWNLIEVIE